MYPGAEDGTGLIPVGKICFVEYFAKNKPCNRRVIMESSGTQCYSQFLSADEYVAPGNVDKSVIPSQFVGVETAIGEIKDAFSFDYTRGQMLTGMYNEYDL